jgi:predicted enzyme related to lactoylglutathione lyase
MPRISSYRHGVPSWIDVSSPDIAGSAAFYCSLFDWEVSPDQGAEFGGYRIFSKGDAPVAGIGPVTGGPPAWTTYIDVTDAATTAARIAPAGGTLAVPPMDLPDGNGRIGFGIDPAGGFFGLFQAGPNHFGAALVNEAGTLVWNELNVRDPHAVLPFYESVFGWTTAAMEGAGPSGYHVISVDGRVVAGVMTMGEGFPEHVPTHWLPYFMVTDAQASVDRCEALGGGVVMPPFPTGMGPMAVLRDPQGAVFAIGAMHQVDDPDNWPT